MKEFISTILPCFANCVSCEYWNGGYCSKAVLSNKDRFATPFWPKIRAGDWCQHFTYQNIEKEFELK